MIERYCFVRLRDELSTDEHRRDLLAGLRAHLAEVPGLAGLVTGVPADDSAARWDLSLVARFASRAELEAAIGTEVWQRTFAELAARSVVMKIWNFTCDAYALGEANRDGGIRPGCGPT